MNRQTYKVLGIPLFSIEYEFDTELEHISNTGGQFERAEVAEYDNDDEWIEEEYSLGFGFGRDE